MWTRCQTVIVFPYIEKIIGLTVIVDLITYAANGVLVFKVRKGGKSITSRFNGTKRTIKNITTRTLATKRVQPDSQSNTAQQARDVARETAITRSGIA